MLERSPATALVDGDNGMGHLVMTYAANLAVEIAREAGIGWVGVRRSNHSGAGSTYVSIPLAQGMVGIYTAVSSSNFMAPWGGAEPLLGTNPIAIAIPAGSEAPVLLDIATSVVSNGQIRSYANAGKPLPEGWVISRVDGTPITDGRRLDEGTFVPMSTYKGSGLASCSACSAVRSIAPHSDATSKTPMRRRSARATPAISSSRSTSSASCRSTPSGPRSIVTFAT